ncbi:MAG: hypothetical protein ACAI25_00565 [Planctomycetota bacterium]
MRHRFAAIMLVGALSSFTGCLGSKTTYRPYKGEPRPAQDVAPDPIRDQVELQHGVPHYVHQDTAYIAETRKAHREVLDRVKYNGDGTRRNSWNAYATDMNSTLGSGTVREAPKNLPKDQQMLKKSEEAGKEKPAEEKPAEGEKKE